MYALLDFEYIKYEQRTKFSKVKEIITDKTQDIMIRFIKREYEESINDFFNGKINEGAFFYCENLINIKLPENIKIINHSAFWNCKKIKNIKLPDSIVSIKDCSFTCCRDLTDIVLPKSIKKINKNVFAYCSKLSSITIPKSVINIESNAFIFCHNLKKIIYEGTEDEWQKINIDIVGNEYLNPTNLKLR